jgi:hypothetical protein
MAIKKITLNELRTLVKQVIKEETNNKKQINEERLKSSWELKDEISNLDMSDELRNEINRFIEINDGKNTGKSQSFGNIYYRSNLHYIIDNIDNTSLLAQLKKINNN